MPRKLRFGRGDRSQRERGQRDGSQRDRGLTLLELVVAVLVLSLGSIAALRAVDQSRIAIGGAEPRALAQIVARNRAQELRLFGGRADLPRQVEMGGRVFRVSVQRARTAGGLIRASITVRAVGGPGAHLVAFVPSRGAGL